MDTLLVALRVALSLAAVLGLLWALQRRLTRGSRATRSQNLVTVVGRQGLGQKASVVVVDIDGRRFVLGVTEQNVNVLHDCDAPPADADAAAGDSVFARSLDAAATGAVVNAVTDPDPESELAPPLILRPRHGVAARSAQTRTGQARPNQSRLGGSILSPATWQQTAAALRQGR
ncbi:flagellar protein FliO/FliZ [Cryobacterium sp. MP_M5]|uniref:flagellar biosynthetic protein FliO n=1 Tax=unclassified Cryobacterium TaxID=2649013 RepID=UPI0018C9187C|nr:MULTISPECIES: flagellar biosynthetic protein FliO [unclassified Cryobacterium]MBG6058421.1 flagellar protein FliO/FliZ [Cryobacterium sp. MP_M3]MEC5176927.1 flagellar protein FliO/FliZ [Cryobacterium sp. MP_M5]